MKFTSTALGSSKEPSEIMTAKFSVMHNVFLCLVQHVEWTKSPKPGSRNVLLEVIGKALYDHDCNPTDIANYIRRTPRSLPTGEELIKLKELHHSRDSNGKQYGEKRPALNLCEEVMNFCIDVYLDVNSPLNTWKGETKDIEDASTANTHTTAHPSDDEWEKVANTSPLPGIDVMKSSSAASGSEEPSNTEVAKLSAMQNVFLFLKVHVDPLFQKPLSRKMMLEYISAALYDNDLKPSEIIDYIGKTPRTLPMGEELIELRQFNQSRDSNGIQYGEKRPAALDLCEEVMNLCIDVYLDGVSPDTLKEEAKRIKDATAATTHTTSTTGKGKAKEVENKFIPTEEFMRHATPSLTSTSYHPAKLQTCVPLLKGANENIPKPPTVIAPSTLPKTASAPTGTSQDLPNLLTRAKEIQAEAELVKKKLNKSTAEEIQDEAQLVEKQLFTAAINEQLLAKKPRALDKVVSHVQLPNTHGVFKDENRPTSTQSKQGKSPFRNPKPANPSFTSDGLDDEPMKPLYSSSSAKEASLWTADPFNAIHGLPTQKSFAQQLSDQLDNPPMAYDGSKSSASLWSKKSAESALLAHGPKPGDVFKDGKLVANSYDLNRHCDITDAAADLAGIPPRQEPERLTGILKGGMTGGKTVSIQSEMRRVAEIQKADAEREVAEAPKFLIPKEKFEKRSLPISKVPGSKPGDVFKDGKLIGNIVHPNREAAIQKARDAVGFTRTQRLEKSSLPAVDIYGLRSTNIQMTYAERQAVEALTAFTPRPKFEKPSLPAANIHGSKAGDIIMNEKVVGNAFDLNRFAAPQQKMKAFLESKWSEPEITPTQKFEKTLTDHAISKMLAGGDTLAPPGHPNYLPTAHVDGMKYAPVSETAAKKYVAPKPADKVPAMKKEFKQGPVTASTKGQFGQGLVTPPKKEITVQKTKVKYATWTQNGDDECAHLVKIAMVPVGLLLLCTFIQIMMNLGTIISTICNVVTPCLALFMDCTSYFWSGLWWLIKSPFLFFGYIFGSLAKRGINLGSGSETQSNSAPVIPAAPIIAPIQSVLTNWSNLRAKKSWLQPQTESSSHIHTFTDNSSPTFTRYESSHQIGATGVKMISWYPFTRHNNSLPYADRCEFFTQEFTRYWGEEMEEKKEKKDGRLDLDLGNELAEVLIRNCNI